MKRLLPLLALLALPALQTGPALAADARLEHRLYDPEAVVRLEGRAGVQATIAFAEDEHIENVAIGDSALWQVTPNKRATLLFVKPLAPRARTNLTVVTDRRQYFFDLVAVPKGRAVYLLHFTYPPEPEKPVQAAAAPAPALTAEEARLAAGAAPVDPASLNFAWKAKGKAALLPARVYDDGSSTYLGWAPGKPVPAILARNGQGAEGPVNYAVREDMIVLDSVPGVLVLRSGRDVATLERAAPAPSANLAAKVD
ncbi:TrbG/VirB9 family P-type conjugative transfer protein [Novosphingobium flavum]|uniref:TrbG/VirB9 family P-type conjugative transfer protein n=1 Tax=Novosphingobium flavum TaxID=1778672 RepID=UPI0031B63111